MFTEIVLVDGAIRGIAISLWFCIMATIIFTGNITIAVAMAALIYTGNTVISLIMATIVSIDININVLSVGAIYSQEEPHSEYPLEGIK